MPARVEGTWQWNDGRKYEITLRQHFQMIEGLARIDGQTAQFRNGKLRGDKLNFTLIEFRGLDTVQREFTGRVSGNVIEGTVRLPHNAIEEKWSARRVN